LKNKIQILPEHLYNKIAAGEVVNRPGSVVKELIENSIDSGATRICLIVKEAGKALIQVNDNGSGMTEEDAAIAFRRHSTSKIKTYDDLENILTLGFRGEALASIAAIAHVELKTRISDDDIGTLVRIEGNDVKEITKISSDKGTSVAIKNLFYNTPGRRNFLKSNQTEFRHIYETFVKLAISHPETEFEFYNNDDLLFNLPKRSLQLRIQDLFGDDFGKTLLNVENGNQIINVKGFISRPGFTKKSKQDQFLFLNGRFFTNKSLNFAVYSAYDDLIEKGNYPSFFLFIHIDPKKVDVNVHPSKLEVKFEDEGAVFGFLRKSVRDTLRSSDLTFDIGFGDSISFENEPQNLEHRGSQGESSAGLIKSETSDRAGFTGGNTSFTHGNSGFTEGFRQDNVGSRIHSIFEASNPLNDINSDESVSPAEQNSQSAIFEHTKKDDTEKFNIWQFRNKYVMCETETGLMIIDQHAAHERILYEKAVLLLNSHAAFSQQLLIPLNIKLTKIDFHLAESLKEELQNLGFNFILRTGSTLELTGIPSDIKPGDEHKIFQELLDQYKEYEVKLNLEKRDNLAKSFACRSAVKAGDRLLKQEMVSLVDNLFAAQMPYVCPHGRPTVIRITTEELDKRFSRT
jgi:DNA mismatch repair protein MutL